MQIMLRANCTMLMLFIFSFFLLLCQVAGAVVKSGGDQIQTESDEFVVKNGPVKTGEIAVTGPGNLPCKIVIHAVGRMSFY